MKIKDLYNILYKKYSFENQEIWDNSKLELFSNEEIKNIVISLDITNDSINEAINSNANLIIVHHPLFIDDLDNTNSIPASLYSKLKSNNINAIYIHTPIDKYEFGLNAILLKELNLCTIKPGNDTNDFYVAILKDSMKLKEFAIFVKEKYKLSSVSYLTKFENNEINKIAICSGSGGSLLEEVAKIDVDVFLTGDIKYHTWLDSEFIELPLLEINHNVENIFIDIVANDLKEIISNKINIVKFKKIVDISTI
ncbi:MAG: Nif3-like dinuclear metal center hexameric protein [Mycoplasma sp.]